MKTTVVIVARQGSSRLPGKALAEIKGRPIIGLMVDRIRKCPLVNEVIIATSTKKEDDALEEFGKAHHVKVFRGHPEDVLDRIYNAVKDIDCELIVEIGGDCPFVGPELIEKGIRHYEETKADFVTNALLPPYTAPNGYDFIGITKNALEKVQKGAILKSERYQPFQYIVRNSKDFKTYNFSLEGNYSNWRWTLDYKEDFDFIKRVFEEFHDTNPLFEFDEIKNLLDKDPSIIKLNQMHHDPIVEYSAWSTGSYVAEMHDDIVSLLKMAKKTEDEKDFTSAQLLYQKIEGFTAELIARTNSKLSTKINRNA
jgi:spore coat polysaccharide biosynthesis protein SpsF